MSLIDDALQRAQTTLSEEEAQPLVRPRSTEALPSLRRFAPARKSRLLTMLMLGGIAVSVLGLARLTEAVWNHRLTLVSIPTVPPASPTTGTLSSILPAVASESVSPAPAVARAVTLPAPTPRPRVFRAGSAASRFKLQGIIQGDGEAYAIINETIVRAGENLEGATVVAVNSDSAQLRWRDQDLQIRLDR